MTQMKILITSNKMPLSQFTLTWNSNGLFTYIIRDPQYGCALIRIEILLTVLRLLFQIHQDSLPSGDHRIPFLEVGGLEGEVPEIHQVAGVVVQIQQGGLEEVEILAEAIQGAALVERYTCSPQGEQGE